MKAGEFYHTSETVRVLYIDDLDVLLRRVSDGMSILLSRGQWDGIDKTQTKGEPA